MTVLFREGGSWHKIEVRRLAMGLGVEVIEVDAKPECIVLCPGHFTKDQILEAILGGIDFTVTPISGKHDPAYPF